MSFKITIVIPTYKRPRALRRCLSALESQTHKSFKVIISNNDVDSDLSGLTNEFPHLNLAIISPPENIGSIPNFNFGIKHVTTRYFTLLSDDDFLLKDYVENFYEMYSRTPDLDLYAQRCLVIDQNGDFLTENYCVTRGVYTGARATNMMINEQLPNTWSAFAFRKNRASFDNLVPTDVGPFADGLYTYKKAYQGCGFYTDSVGAVLVTHSENVSSEMKDISANAGDWTKNSIKYGIDSNFFGLGIKYAKLHEHGNLRHQLITLAKHVVSANSLLEALNKKPIRTMPSYPFIRLLCICGLYIMKPVLIRVRRKLQQQRKISITCARKLNEVKKFIGDHNV